MTPWQHLESVRAKHQEAQARVRCAEQLAHLGPERAQALAAARREEQRVADVLAAAQAQVEALRRAAAHRARVLPPDPGDHDVRGLLIRLDRHFLPETWEGELRQRGDPVALRALRHLPWLRSNRGAL